MFSLTPYVCARVAAVGQVFAVRVADARRVLHTHLRSVRARPVCTQYATLAFSSEPYHLPSPPLPSHLSAKYNESEEDVPDLQTLEDITQQPIPNETVLNYELFALKKMGWKITGTFLSDVDNVIDRSTQ